MIITEKLIFIHIPKTAGKSIRELLRQERSYKYVKGHPTFDEILKINPKLLYTKQSFCVVRNPFDRFVSLYRHGSNEIALKKLFGKNYLKIKDQVSTFEKFIHNFNPPKRWIGRSIFTPQKDWSNNVANIFRFENLEEIINFLDKNNFKGKLPHINATNFDINNKYSYRKYYNQATKNLIRDKFEEDLNYFNYDF